MKVEEQQAFEAWAMSQGFNMAQHPLHYLFLDAKINAARQAWKAALAAVIPAIQAEALERAAVVMEEHYAPGAAAAIRALKEGT